MARRSALGQWSSAAAPPGDLARAPAGDGRQMEAVQHLPHAPVPLQPRPAFGREEQVFPQGHVGEQGVILKNVAAMAAAGRQVDAAGGVEEDLVVQQDAATVGAWEAGDQSALGSCPRRRARTERDRRHAALNAKSRVKPAESAPAGKRLLIRTWIMPRAFVSSRLAAQTIAMARSEMTSTSSRASRVLPDLHRVVDGDGGGLRAAAGCCRRSSGWRRSRPATGRTPAPGGQHRAPRQRELTRQKTRHSEAPRLRAAFS